KRKAAPMMEFCTVKRIDNSRLVRHVEPAKQKSLLKTVGLGGVVALFFLFRSEEHTSELQSLTNLVCRLLLEKKNTQAAHVSTVHKQAVVIPALSKEFYDSPDISQSGHCCVWKPIKLCSVDIPIVFISAITQL